MPKGLLTNYSLTLYCSYGNEATVNRRRARISVNGIRIERLDSEVSIMSRRTLGRRVDDMELDMTTKLKDEQAKQEFVCTTADIWSSSPCSFLGVTVHVVRPTGAGGPSRGGGLGVVCRQSVPVRVHHLANKLQTTTFELQLLRIGAASSPLTFVHVYRPQWMSTVSSFVDEFADIIAMVTSECSDNIIVCGDMNCPGRNDSSVDV